MAAERSCCSTARRLPVSPVALLGVDANLLPLGAVERIEVLKDGAAATYGSDAIAGVVNFISRRGYDGLSIDGVLHLDRGQ